MSAEVSAVAGGAPVELVTMALRVLLAAPGPDPQRRVIAECLEQPSPVVAADVLADLARRLDVAAVDGDQVQAAACALAADGVVVRLVGHPGYPTRLARAWPELGAPAFLLARAPAGGLPDGPAVAVVGTRRASLAGREVAAMLARRLAGAGVTVVSGLARGIDQAAHRGALEAGGATVGVAGCGLDVDYPRGAGGVRRDVAASGGLVGELPPGAPPRPPQFLWRNRIISGLADAVVVIEGGVASGALHTARMGASQGRDVWAAPGCLLSPRAQGPLALIRDGATVLADVDDLLVAVTGRCGPDGADGDDSATGRAAPLSPPERTLLDLLDPHTPATIGALAQQAALPVGTVMEAVGELVTRGLAHQTPRGVIAAP